MGVGTLLAITRTLGLCGVLYVDPALVAEMARLQRIATNPAGLSLLDPFESPDCNNSLTGYAARERF
jgi:hypothetical protein